MLARLQLKAELWIIKSDFALDFAHLLLPNTVYIGGLMAKPAESTHQVKLEHSIWTCGIMVLLVQGWQLSRHRVNVSLSFKEIAKQCSKVIV